MLIYIATISLFSILYAYFGYPLVLLYYKGSSRRENKEGERPKSISLIIAARQEGERIGEKLEQCVALRLPGEDIKFEIIVADDASDDATGEIVERYKSKGVIHARLDSRGGKEVAQKHAVGLSSGEIIIFTDTKVALSEDILERALEYFSDSSIGAVSSVDRVLDENGESGEGLYVKYEMMVRELESEIHSLVGLSGSCFIVRREIALNLRPDLPSDFYSATEAVRLGFRAVLAKDIVGTYKAVVDTGKEFERKVRTVIRGMSALLNQEEVFDVSKYGFYTFQIISHKVYRWLVPWFFLILLFSTFFLRSCSYFWAIVFWAQALSLVLSAVGHYSPEYRKSPIVKIPLFFVLSNFGILVAAIRLLRGEMVTAWDPSNKG